MNNYILLILAFSVLLTGCVVQPAAEPAPQEPETAQLFVCPDGVNVLSDLKDCPPYDKEYEACMGMSAPSDYYSENPRDKCFYDLAIDRDNISLCKKITGDDYYGYYTAGGCGAELAMYSNDPEMCEELGLLYKSDCYAELAIQLDDPEMCNYVTSFSKKDGCLYDYLWENEYYITDWSFCEDFSANSDNYDYCYYAAATNTGTLSYCDNLESSSSYYAYYTKSSCYASIAIDKYNPSICGQLSSTSDRDDCYYDYAYYNYEMNVCNNIIDSNLKETCLWDTNDSYNYYDYY